MRPGASLPDPPENSGRLNQLLTHRHRQKPGRHPRGCGVVLRGHANWYGQVARKAEKRKSQDEGYRQSQHPPRRLYPSAQKRLISNVIKLSCFSQRLIIYHDQVYLHYSIVHLPLWLRYPYAYILTYSQR